MSQVREHTSLDAKLELRRYFLRRYHHATPLTVIDCCQGSGRLWKVLRREFPVASYWGLDRLPTPGRLRVASERILAQPGWRASVVDVDTFGHPWRHWSALLVTVASPITVFLTIGRWTIPKSSKAETDLLGLSQLPSLPSVLSGRVSQRLATRAMLGQAAAYGRQIVEAQQTASGPRMTYVGIRLEPA